MGLGFSDCLQETGVRTNGTVKTRTENESREGTELQDRVIDASNAKGSKDAGEDNVFDNPTSLYSRNIDEGSSTLSRSAASGRQNSRIVATPGGRLRRSKNEDELNRETERRETTSADDSRFLGEGAPIKASAEFTFCRQKT